MILARSLFNLTGADFRYRADPGKTLPRGIFREPP
jgi:hypothetical protein